VSIEEAIKILNTTDSRDITPASQGFRDAVKLGIEALKEIKLDRKNRLPFRHIPLSGETE